MYAQSSAKPIITCRGLVNDTYKMDLILIYPPYMIALACIYIASALKDKDTTSWFEELRVDMNIVSFCIDHFPSIDSVSISLTSPIIFFFIGDTQVKNISMEIPDFYDTYKIDPQRGLPDDKISPVLNKLPAKS